MLYAQPANLREAGGMAQRRYSSTMLSPTRRHQPLFLFLLMAVAASLTFASMDAHAAAAPVASTAKKPPKKPAAPAKPVVTGPLLQRVSVQLTGNRKKVRVRVVGLSSQVAAVKFCFTGFMSVCPNAINSGFTDKTKNFNYWDVMQAPNFKCVAFGQPAKIAFNITAYNKARAVIAGYPTAIYQVSGC